MANSSKEPIVFFSLGLGRKEKTKTRVVVYEGQPVAIEVGDATFFFSEVGLPDWDLLFIEPIKHKEAAIRCLAEFGFKIHKVAERRVYFSLG